MITVDQAKDVIEKMKKSEFTSHDFIQWYIKLYEKDYVEGLYEYRNSTNGIFRAFHSQIGLFLSNEMSDVIRKRDIVLSENIKDYISENHLWTKL